jgi:hypothetical protein
MVSLFTVDLIINYLFFSWFAHIYFIVGLAIFILLMVSSIISSLVMKYLFIG